MVGWFKKGIILYILGTAREFIPVIPFILSLIVMETSNFKQKSPSTASILLRWAIAMFGHKR